MKFIHKTVALCNSCYKHIPGNVIEDDGQIKLVKRCPEHGEMTSIVEIDTEFYYGLRHDKPPEINLFLEPLLFEVTDKCQLDCPHCYHLPDNKTEDRSRDNLRELFSNFPKGCFPMLAGAEPTLRKDFADLCGEISKLGFPKVMVLTNGIKFADEDFTREVFEAGAPSLCIGLNHWSYQGKRIHNKQLKAIDNLIKYNYEINYIGYTLENLDHLPEVLAEIKDLHSKLANPEVCHFRIRCGSFIGRSNDKQRSYLSNLIKRIQLLAGDDVRFCNGDDNPYHVVMFLGNIILRLIQWPDVTNMDLEELDSGPWCQFYDGPVTNFVHQVITRDAYINNKLPPADLVPVKYRHAPTESKSYWKDGWKGPVEVTELDWTWMSPEATPVAVPKIIPIGIATEVKL
jgi:hypothetical protein